MCDKVIPVKVALRIRPISQKEKLEGCTECLRTVSDQPQVTLAKDKSFTYDYVFSQKTPQIDVYETCVQPLLNSLFKGYNATVLAYGQTGSGKTYTMGSGYLSLYSARSNLNDNQMLNLNDLDDVGVIPRVMNDLFSKIEDSQRDNKDVKFQVKVSFVEVYNEEIKDLFNLKSSASEPLNIREENNSIRVANLSEIEVNNALSTVQLLEKGSSQRVVGGTAMNDQSSRSHAIFTVSLEQTNTVEDSLIKSKFHLVDLAGSERQSKTKAEGLRLKEGININLGLLALGNVISVLGEENNSNKIKHVPYRESKLTRLLQDSLGGNSHTVMIACVSPADSNMEETLNTLRYADRARKIKNKPIVNIDPQAAELNSLRQQVQQLKAHVYQLTGGGTIQSPEMNSTEMIQVKEENEKLKSENSKLFGELQRMIKVHRITYEKMLQCETEKEELKARFDDIKLSLIKFKNEQNNHILNMTATISSTNNGSADESLHLNGSKSILNELESKLEEFDQMKVKEEQNQPNTDQEMNENNENGNDNIIEPADKDYAFRQAQMQFQLSEYDSELAKKEQIFRKMIENNMSSQNGTSRYDINMDELKSKINALEKEKEELLDIIRAAESKKVSEQKRDRLKQLEVEVMDLKKKEREFARMLRLKEENEKHCEKLRQEIQTIKQERVKLIKQMRADSESFRKFKQEKEKEVNQLKAIERKRLVEISKLQEGNHRQEAVLRRKNEEINRIQRQLRETLEKQKQVAEKRQQAFDRKDSSTLGDKLRTWITQELELSVNIAEAKINLNKLIEERRESAAELAKLEEKLNELINSDDEPPVCKRKYFSDLNENNTPKSGNNDELDLVKATRGQIEDRIERIKEDIECKSIQINDIQQMILEGDQDEKTKHMFNNIHGLLEAKVLLKHLYNSGVQYLLDFKLKQIQYENSSNGLTQELSELKKKYETMEVEFNSNKKNYSKEINNLTQHYEQRILFLLKSSLTNSETSNDERLNIVLDQIQQMEKKLDPEMQQFQQPDRFAEPFPRKRDRLNETITKEDHRRTQKLKREHRKTRIIRTIPEFDASNLNFGNKASNQSEFNSPLQQIDENSPCYYEDSPLANLIATPDDPLKDPDWAKTPIKSRRTRLSVNKKPLLRKSKSTSQTTLPALKDVDELVTLN